MDKETNVPHSLGVAWMPHRGSPQCAQFLNLNISQERNALPHLGQDQSAYNQPKTSTQNPKRPPQTKAGTYVLKSHPESKATLPTVGRHAAQRTQYARRRLR